MLGVVTSVGSEASLPQNLAPLLTSCVTLGKLLPLSELQFPHTENEGYDRSFFSGSEKNEMSVSRGCDSVWNIIGLDYLAYYYCKPRRTLQGILLSSPFADEAAKAQLEARGP